MYLPASLNQRNGILTVIGCTVVKQNEVSIKLLIQV